MRKIPNIIILCALLLSLSVHAGFSVNNGTLLDANGNAFIMRGVNHPHTWYTQNTAAFTDIAQTGANTIRVVLSTGGQWTRNNGSDVTNVINLCKDNKVICVLEVHDSTGYPEKNEAVHISNATDYWLSSDIQAAITGQEDYVIINIANEPFGNGVGVNTYINDHITAIQTLRNGGLTHTLMVDAANWGQDWQFFMRDNANTIFNADTAANTIFSVHMYEVFDTSAKVESYLQAFADANLVLLIGEFGATHNGNNVDENAILQFAEQFGMGYLGWSWSGNGSCCTDLDMVINFDPNNLSIWGNRLINGINGIASTSVPASVYGGTGNTVNAIINALPNSSSVTGAGSITLDAGNSTGTNLSYQWTVNTSDASLYTLTTPNAVTTQLNYSAPASTTNTIINLTVTDGQNTDSAAFGFTHQPEIVASGNCEYILSNEWSTGFVASIRITNTGTNAISNWSVNWTMLESQISSSWNANLVMGSPNTASGLSWNAIIQPGQYAEFGIQGSKNTLNASAEIPTISGSVCN